jgi:hypothetical protein
MTHLSKSGSRERPAIGDKCVIPMSAAKRDHVNPNSGSLAALGMTP